jgi:hypothetical protein
MFVVEPGAGKTKLYSSAQEFGAAIRRSELGPEARIYHRSTGRWLPITVHPEYRKIAAEREQLSALELQARQWTFLPDTRPGCATMGEPRRPSPSATGPVLFAGDPEPSWLGTTFRKLRNLAHL